MSELSDQLNTVLSGRYRIERELGHGGMATVFLAEDLKHRRLVALKVLDPNLASTIGPERFLREITTVAGLTHPHILALYDSGAADGLLYYVMPYMTGESLRDCLTRERQLPAEDALRIAGEVAEALGYAHSHGVIHRDVKPENILLEGGHAVVADFGVARAVEQAGGEKLTTVGIAMGTPAYMSPEQAAGRRDLDGRSDLYSLACVVYEMLAGEPPFRGPAEGLMYQHISVVPRLVTELRPGVPASVATALNRALAKTPADRFGTAARFAQALGRPEGAAVAWQPMQAPSRPARRSRPRLLVTLGGVALVAILAATGWLVFRPRPTSHMPPPEQRQLTDEGTVFLADLSPDGGYLTYLAGDFRSKMKLMLRDLSGGKSLVIADSVAVWQSVRWSPDGKRIGLSAELRGDRGLWLFPRLGGAPEFKPGAPLFAWSPDGSRMARWWRPSDKGIQVVNLRSGETHLFRVPGTDAFIVDADWSYGGRLALLTRSSSASSHLWTLDLTDGAHALILTDSTRLRAPRWAPRGGAIYYLRDDDLYRITIELRTGRGQGASRRVMSLENTAGFSISADDRKLSYTKISGYSNYSVVRADAGGKVGRTEITAGTAEKNGAALSPDGSSLAFLERTSDGWDLFRVSAEGGTPQRLTFGGAADRLEPAWDSAGRQLAFTTKVGTERKVAVISSNGGPPRVFQKTNVSDEITWAPSSFIAYQVPGNRNYSLLDPITESERPLVRNDSVGWMFSPAFSPDGKRVAVDWNRPGGGVWLISLVDGSQVRLSKTVGFPHAWSRDGRSVYFWTRSGGYRRLPVTGGEEMVMRGPAVESAFCDPYEGPNGLVWICEESKSWSDAWMIENFDPEYADRIQGSDSRSAVRR